MNTRTTLKTTDDMKAVCKEHPLFKTAGCLYGQIKIANEWVTAGALGAGGAIIGGRLGRIADVIRDIYYDGKHDGKYRYTKIGLGAGGLTGAAIGANMGGDDGYEKQGFYSNDPDSKWDASVQLGLRGLLYGTLGGIAASGGAKENRGRNMAIGAGLGGLAGFGFGKHLDNKLYDEYHPESEEPVTPDEASEHEKLKEVLQDRAHQGLPMKNLSDKEIEEHYKRLHSK
jgi:hypothetical protein